MYSYGKTSRARLSTCALKLQEIAYRAIEVVDIIILEGRRDEATQNRYHAEGKSKLKFPDSCHNSDPSNALDWAIWHKEEPHIHWNSREEFVFLAGLARGIALELGYDIRCGADWNGDGTFDEKFFDGPHVELVTGRA